jgi:hypothetical protein
VIHNLTTKNKTSNNQQVPPGISAHANAREKNPMPTNVKHGYFSAAKARPSTFPMSDPQSRYKNQKKTKTNKCPGVCSPTPPPMPARKTPCQRMLNTAIFQQQKHSVNSTAISHEQSTIQIQNQKRKRKKQQVPWGIIRPPPTPNKMLRKKVPVKNPTPTSGLGTRCR